MSFHRAQKHNIKSKGGNFRQVRSEFTDEELGVGFIVKAGPGEATCTLCADGKKFANDYRGRLAHTRGRKHQATVAKQG